ncbi:helix-turn-helix transcriptional regulator [Micromonospora musae]|uniref:helix-turn-helix transcriptional regulator n=1 Tax=Micromonospora musae TaxID=1894970 RepID=UPI003F4D9D78
MTAMATSASGYGGTRNWTFLTNHGHVLLAIARNPTARLRDVADEVGVTERAAQAIVADLEAGGYLSRTRVGRRNEYTLNPAGRFRHPAEADLEVGALLALFTERPDTAVAGPTAAADRSATNDAGPTADGGRSGT